MSDESGSFCPDCGAALRAAMDNVGTSSATKLLGTVVDGQFHIESIIGGGAFGTVYRGTQVGLDRPVALKVPTYEIAADPVMARRFAREARSAARVVHPGVVAIHAVGELPDGRPYLAMQLVEGEPLDRVLADGPVMPVRALRIVRAIASALSETHAAHVVHRDLKPSNVMWRRDRNGDDRITLVDFGIAVCKPGNADASRLTADGLIGTPHYMSPEQAHGDDVDARADLYACGCLLYELVTGKPPFEGSGFEVLLAHLGRPAPVPSATNPAVPVQVDRLCLALMQKKPDNRPQSADELVQHIDDALDALAGRASSSSRRVPTLNTAIDTGGYAAPHSAETPRTRRSRRVALGVGAGVLVAALAGFAAVELRGRHIAEADTADDIAEPAENDARVGRLRSFVKDNGEMLVTVLVPDPLVANQETRMRLEIKNKLGQPVVADQVVLTVADASGAAKGLTARPRRSAAGGEPPPPGRYYFRYTFPGPGTYVLRVFPPSIVSSFEIPIDVK